MSKRFRSIVLFFILCLLCTILLFSPKLLQPAQAATLPFIVLSEYSKTMQVGDSDYLIAVTSTGKKPTFKSNHSSVVSVNTYGKLTAKSSGTATITVKLKNAETKCKIKVKKTTILLNKTTVRLYRLGAIKLKATISTGHTPVWRSNRTSIATVTSNGIVRAKKHGTATITATVDGVKKTCTITVEQPQISLSHTSAVLAVGESFKLTASISSGNAPKWSSSNPDVASVSQAGTVKARKSGKATIYCREDGIKKSCAIKVTQP